MSRPFSILVVLAALVAQGCSGCDDSNTNKPDGQVDAPTDAPQTEEVVCETLAPVTSGTCEVTPGGSNVVLKGIVLTPNTIYRGGQVTIDAVGQIACVGCDCATGGETVVSCPDGAISPGLINTHDHITYTQNKPYTDTGIRYEHRHQWRRGDGPTRPKIPAAGGASADQIRWGELRFLMGGATSIIGSGGQPGILRNLDTASQEGLSQTPVNFDVFPLDDGDGIRRTGDCNYGGEATTASSIAADDAYEPHTSEGIDPTARNEFLCQSSDSYDVSAPGTSNNLLLGKTAMIHAIGLQPGDLGAMAQASTGLIWSPRSNITLYGDTARVTVAQRMGVEIALGTDWMPTGSMNLLRELRCADDLNKTYYNNHFTDVQLWQMVTSNAAAVAATDDVIGLLAAGKVADIAIFRANGGKTFRSVIEAEPADVVLVMRGGKVLYGDEAAVAALAPTCDVDPIDVCGSSKRACLTSEVGKNYAALKTAAGANTPLAFECSTPPNEPSCSPKRSDSVLGSTIYTGVPSATDADGDGIEDASDKCPMVFDPIRPVDNALQADADDDGVGDVCDVCPLDANTSTCTVVNPNDRDNDGKDNSADNCPDTANPDQADGDDDGKGDVCDACPTTPNPGSAGCPATIYTIKNGTTAVGTTVRVVNALVTGKGANGFFVQTKTGDAGYAGPDHSGLFVFTGTGTPPLANATVGARVTIDGRVALFQGQTELDTVTNVTVEMPGPEALPDPIAVSYADVKTGGPRALTLESVIVSLGAANVTATNTMFGEFTLTAGAETLIADDFLFVPAPPITTGQTFTSVRGILTLRQSVSKLEPRSAADLTAGAPGLASLSPALSYARVGVTTNDPTFPTPLRVNLTGPAQGATVVTITSGSTDLTVANVTVPDGATFVNVPVTAVAQNPGVTVTATLGTAMATANVRVLGAAEAPTTVTISPPDAAVAINGTVLFTVTLDTPALVASVVNLAVNPANAGSLPATVTVPINQTSATFTYTNQSTSGSATVTATFGASTSMATVTVSTGANHLVINEVDYDQPSTDTAEFIEIFNPSTAAVSLTGKQVLLINAGNNNEVYDTIDLTGSLPSGGYLVITTNVTVPPPAIKLDPGWSNPTGNVQNGAPDGIALIDNTAKTLIDGLSYEGAMLTVTLPGFPGPVSLTEGGTPTTATDIGAGALCRSPNGQDTDKAVDDWQLCATTSAGTANP